MNKEANLNPLILSLDKLRKILEDNGLIIIPKNDNYDETECLLNVADDLDEHYGVGKISYKFFDIKDKQPEVGQEVITFKDTYKHGYVMKHCYYNGIDEDGDYSFIETETSIRILAVTHWLPVSVFNLPEES